jgi:hypothetical protein
LRVAEEKENTKYWYYIARCFKQVHNMAVHILGDQYKDNREVFYLTMLSVAKII